MAHRVVPELVLTVQCPQQEQAVKHATYAQQTYAYGPPQRNRFLVTWMPVISVCCTVVAPWREKDGYACIAAPTPCQPPVPPASASAPELMHRLTGLDIERCPHCHQGRLAVIATLYPLWPLEDVPRTTGPPS